MSLAQLQHAIDWWQRGHGSINIDLLEAVLRAKEKMDAKFGD